MLCQPISCRVIRTNCDVFDVVQTGESLKSFGCKLWAIVSDNLNRDAPSSNNRRSSQGRMQGFGAGGGGCEVILKGHAPPTFALF